MALRLLPLIKRLHIIDKNGDDRLFPILPGDGKDEGWAQRAFLDEIERQFNDGKPVRIIVCKARQLGFSTISEAVLFIWATFLFQNMQGLVIAHENNTTRSLFQKTQHYWNTAPWRTLLEARHATQGRFLWTNGSGIQTATAKNLAAGVGLTLQALHTSEAAKYIDAYTLMGGLRQTMPERHGTIEIVESTAQGVGNWFHSEWLRAVEGESAYVPLFFPWFPHWEYKRSTTLCTRTELTAEERRLLKLGADYENIEWRRYMIPNKLNYDDQLFVQEYPATAEEAFVTSGTNVFDLDHLRACYEPVGSDTEAGQPVVAAVGRMTSPYPDGANAVWHPEPGGPLTVFKRPSARPDDKLYMVGVDPTKTTEGDPSCITVINRSTNEQVAVWHGHDNGYSLAREAMMLGRYYHNAMICTEVQGGGMAVIGALQMAGYPNLWKHKKMDRTQRESQQVIGFKSGYDNKRHAVECLKYLMANGWLHIHDRKTFDQASTYIVLPGGWELGAADPKTHDDAVIALMLACYASMTEPAYTSVIEPRPQALDIYEQYGVTV